MPKETRYYNFTLKVDANRAYLNWLEQRLTNALKNVISIEDDHFIPQYAENSEYEGWEDAELRIITGSHLQLPLPLMGSEVD